MSTITEPKTLDELQAITELTDLKDLADSIGLDYPKNITFATLQKNIAEFLELKPAAKENEETKLTRRELFSKQREKLLKLHLVNIAPRDGVEMTKKGEIFCVANRIIGTIRKMVMYQVDWCIPYVLLMHIKNAKTTIWVERDVGNGKKVKVQEIVPAYVVEDKGEVTEEQLAKWKEEQLARGQG